MADRPIPPYPANGWEWCPEHGVWYAAGEACPICSCDGAEGVCPADFGLPCASCDGIEGDWDPDDVVGLGPEVAEDGWYFDLLRRASHPGDDRGWRDA